jgi:2-polyprenyl-3-methyl-5-hydroxy-6-metoxy-1,4-benzoquinol methylase
VAFGGIRAERCPACGETGRSEYARHKEWTLHECGGCGLIYIDPLPDAALLDFMYRDTYTGATESYFGKVGRKMRRSRRRMAALARRVPAGRFLDVGCNGGFMAEAARARGFESWGIDVDPVSIAYAREHYPGCRFERMTLEDFVAARRAQGSDAFELLYCSEVIEHVPAVDRFAAALAAALAPGGHLYITTPDIGHWRRPRDLASWDGFAPPAHCLYFRPRSLAHLLARHGLEIVSRGLAFKPGIKMLCRKTG